MAEVGARPRAAHLPVVVDTARLPVVVAAVTARRVERLRVVAATVRLRVARLRVDSVVLRAAAVMVRLRVALVRLRAASVAPRWVHRMECSPADRAGSIR